MAKPDVYVGLVHWPVLNKKGDIIATNVTNFDIHDIARVCRAYGVKKYFIINPMKEQLMFVSRVLEHWKIGEGGKLNPKRQMALRNIELKETLEQAVESLDEKPHIVATAARDIEKLSKISFPELKEDCQKSSGKPIFLVFGTGFGLHNEALSQCDSLLEPIKGGSEDDYRHLSVRSAVSICLDRLLAK